MSSATTAAAHAPSLDGQVAHLETDKPENVRFYARARFAVVGEGDVLGVPNRYMCREPRVITARP